jgi:small subunit ribosomal protein S20
VPQEVDFLFIGGYDLLPNINAAKKWVRASDKRRQRNQNVKTKLKSLYKSAVTPGAAPEAKKLTASAFDKAAARGIIHKNKANRKKSRIAKRAAKAA